MKAKLLEKLTYDRVGYGNAFNAISLDVQNGLVTLGGHERTDVDKDSALALVSTYPGVKDVTDEIEVDPTSIMDDQTRLAVARAVYGYPTLNKYAIDPAKPIRISVQNGNVALYGVVDSKADKDTANIRANGVPGVFSVKNFLQVAGQPTEGVEMEQGCAVPCSIFKCPPLFENSFATAFCIFAGRSPGLRATFTEL